MLFKLIFLSTILIKDGKCMIKEIANLRGTAGDGGAPTIMVLDEDQPSFTPTTAGGRGGSADIDQDNDMDPVSLSFNT